MKDKRNKENETFTHVVPFTETRACSLSKIVNGIRNSNYELDLLPFSNWKKKLNQGNKTASFSFFPFSFLFVFLRLQKREKEHFETNN